MPRQILPHLEGLFNQINGIVSHYRRILDDEFLFGSGAQIPQVATIFDRVDRQPLNFSDESLQLTELLTLIAYRYGFEQVRVAGFGGYALVLGHDESPQTVQRRVLRLVPEHHVRNIIMRDATPHEFDVRLDDRHEPIRPSDYPLILSDLFLMPRHTTKLVFHEIDGTIAKAGGYPASLHCQLLPEVRAFNHASLDPSMAREAGDLLEVALATLGVSVADAHGGNGGALVGADTRPIIHQINGKDTYIPIVLDYGYYSKIGAKTLAQLLLRYGVTSEMMQACVARHAPHAIPASLDPTVEHFAQVIEQSGVSRGTFGKLLYHLPTPLLDPSVWIDYAEHHWRTAKEKIYPPLQSQSRLDRMYPYYDEVLFPQRIEEYHFTR